MKCAEPTASLVVSSTLELKIGQIQENVRQTKLKLVLFRHGQGVEKGSFCVFEQS